MVSNPGNRWAVAGATFVVWGLVAASAVYWGMKLSSAGSGSPVAPIARSAAVPDPAATARLLGAAPGAAAAPIASLSSRFALQGVVAEPDGGGAALIAVDGKPPKPYRVGAPIDENLVLKSVDPRRATLAANLQAPPAVTLELPLKR
ncbi:type II secretion system protein N [Ramlibacter sp. PS4R-6]|uniref:type II secretion system protein N n=1 Tax=Ramlibacter sp. PS4R-6 TaxID=3133438 RepID=UPI0030AD4B25